jgi:ribosomal protein S18 acetylase RimI-like enzyme
LPSSCSVRNTPIFVRDIRKTSLLSEIVVRFSNGVELGGPWRSVEFQETQSSLVSSSVVPSLSSQKSEVFTLVAKTPAILVQPSSSTSETTLGFSRLSSSLEPEALHLELFVVSEYRRLGIGSALLTKTLEVIRTRRKQEKKEIRLIAKISEISEEERKVASKLLTSFGFITSSSGSFSFSLNL